MRRAPLVLSGRFDQRHLWRKRPVELLQPLRPELDDFGQCPISLFEEFNHVYTLAMGRERTQVGDAATEHVDGTVVVQSFDVVEAYADLQDPLVEIPYVARFCSPQLLEWWRPTPICKIPW